MAAGPSTPYGQADPGAVLTNRSVGRMLEGVRVATTRTFPSPRVLLPWWRRLSARPEQPTSPPLQRLAADLRRLEHEAERLLGDPTVLARGQRLIAVRQAFDLVVLDAAQALEVELPTQRAPFTREERFLATVELTRAGLRW